MAGLLAAQVPVLPASATPTTPPSQQAGATVGGGPDGTTDTTPRTADPQAGETVLVPTPPPTARASATAQDPDGEPGASVSSDAMAPESTAARDWFASSATTPTSPSSSTPLVARGESASATSSTGYWIKQTSTGTNGKQYVGTATPTGGPNFTDVRLTFRNTSTTNPGLDSSSWFLEDATGWYCQFNSLRAISGSDASVGIGAPWPIPDTDGCPRSTWSLGTRTLVYPLTVRWVSSGGGELVYLLAPGPRGVAVESTYGTCATCPGAGTALSATGPLQAFRADPVNTATGSFVTHADDLAYASAGIPLRLSRTYNSADPTDDLSHSGARDVGNGLTRAGQKLTQHGGQGTFPVSTGSRANINRLGQEQLVDILTAPDTVTRGVTGGSFPGGRYYIASDGRGALFDANGTFQYFGVFKP